MDHSSDTSRYDHHIDQKQSPRGQGHTNNRYQEHQQSPRQYEQGRAESNHQSNSSGGRRRHDMDTEDNRFTIQPGTFTELQTLLNDNNEEYVILKRWRNSPQVKPNEGNLSIQGDNRLSTMTEAITPQKRKHSPTKAVEEESKSEEKKELKKNKPSKVTAQKKKKMKDRNMRRLIMTTLVAKGVLNNMMNN